MQGLLSGPDGGAIMTRLCNTRNSAADPGDKTFAPEIAAMGTRRDCLPGRSSLLGAETRQTCMMETAASRSNVTRVCACTVARADMSCGEVCERVFYVRQTPDDGFRV